MRRPALQRPRIGIGGGLRAFAGGIGFIISSPAVWGYALVPVAMVLVLMCGLSWLGVKGAYELANYLAPESDNIGSGIGLFLLQIAFVVAALLLALLFSLGLAQPLSAFALLAIVDAQEHALTGMRLPRPEFFDAWLRGLRVTLVSLTLCVPIFIGLFVVDLVFPPAALITVPLKFLIFAWLLAWNFLDYPLGLRQMGVGASLSWMARHSGAVTAFGSAWALLVVVPPIILLFLPMGVAGATRLVVESELSC